MRYCELKQKVFPCQKASLISVLEKLNLFHFSCLMSLGAIDVKMDGFVLEEKSSLICWPCLFYLNSIVTVK